MKRTFVINWILIDLFIVSVISWFRPHVTGRGNSHEIWHNLAMFHVLGSVLFPVAIIFHMATHWDWYKGIIKKWNRQKNKATAVLSIIFLLLSLFPVGDVGNIESSLKRTGEKAGCNVRVSPHTAKYTFANDKKQVFLSLKHLITSTEQIMSASMSFLS